MNICTKEEKQVLKQSVAVKRPHKAKAMSSNESDGKKKRRDEKKQQQQKSALPQPTNEASSSQMMPAPCQDGVCAGTSATGFLSSTKQITDHGFWLDTFRKNFEVMQDTKLTKEQSEILQQSFMKLCRKMSCIQRNSDRFLKTHKCFNCKFSISHQCISLDLIRCVPFRNELMDTKSILPDRAVVCDCGFVFYHAHFKRLMEPYKPMRNDLHLYNYSISVSCPKCYWNVVMTTLRKVCCDLTNWDSITGDHRKSFYECVQRLHYPTINKTSFDEFYACSNNCCLLFHLCSERAEDSGAGGTSPG